MEPARLRAAPAMPAPARGTPAPRLALGVTTLALARNGYRHGSPPTSSRSTRSSRARLARRRRHVVRRLGSEALRRRAGTRRRAARQRPGDLLGAVGLAVSGRTAQPKYTLSSIIDGRHDAYIRRWARVSRYGKPLRLRFAQEMNGHAYPWSESPTGTARGSSSRRGGTCTRSSPPPARRNVVWVWSPVAGAHAGPSGVPAAEGGRRRRRLGLQRRHGGVRRRLAVRSRGPTARPLDAIHAPRAARSRSS